MLSSEHLHTIITYLILQAIPEPHVLNDVLAENFNRYTHTHIHMGIHMYKVQTLAYNIGGNTVHPVNV